MFLGEFFFYLTIIVYLAFKCVNEKNLTWLQTSFADYFSRVKVHHADLTCHNHHAALSDSIAAWTQTVTVEHSTGISAVAEQ